MRGGLGLILLLAVIPAAADMTDVPGMERLWELKVGEVGGGPSGQPAGEISVFYLSFSPDGRHLAAVVGRSSSEQYILILDAAEPGKNSRRVDINPGMRYDRSRGDSWSPSGEQIILGSTLIRVSDGTSCALPGNSWSGHFFVGSNQVAGYGYSRVEFFGPDCQEAGTWEVDRIDAVFDASAERGLVCIKQWVDERWSQGEKEWTPSSKGQWSIAVLGINTRTMVRRLPRPRWEDPCVLFADSGRILCEARSGIFSSTVKYWEVDTGREIASTKGKPVIDFRTALRASRGVLSDYTAARYYVPLPGDWVPAEPSARPRRVVWDFGSGKKLVSWRSRFQAVAEKEGQKPEKQPYRFALSPDGEHIAEGGEGVLALYRIRP